MRNPTMNQHPIGGGSRADKSMFSADPCACTCGCTKETEDRSYVLCPRCTTLYAMGVEGHGPA